MVTREEFQSFWKKLTASFPVSERVDAKIVAEEYHKFLSDLSADALYKAYAYLMKTRKLKGLPPVGELRAAAEMRQGGGDYRTQLPSPALIAALIAMTHAEFQAWRRDQLNPPFTDSWHWERREEIALRSPIASLAAQEGWIGTLVDYSVKHAMLPVPAEFAKLKAQGNSFLAELRAHPAKAVTKGIAQIILRRYGYSAELAGLPLSDIQRIYHP